MERMTSFGRALVGLLVLTVLVACQAGPATSPSSPASSSSTATSPPTVPSAPEANAPEGTFVLATDSFSAETFDPSMSFVGGLSYMRLMYDFLTGPDEVGRPSRETGLAEDWSFSDDRMALTYTLREGLLFHDGSPLTSEDVKFSIERAMREDARGSFAAYLQEFIASVEAPDPRTVVVHHTKPTTFTLEYLGPTHTEGIVVPKAYFERVGEEEFERNPIGSGPYRLVEHTRGSQMVFEPAETHSGLRHPTKEQVIMNLVAEPSSRKALLERGEVDLINVGPDIAVELRDADYPIVVSEGSNQILALMHLQADGEPIGDEYPLSDVRVREAMSLAIDRDAIAEHLFGGFAEPTTAFRTFGPLLTTIGASHDDFADSYDPDRARQLLQDAGYPDRFGDNAEIGMFAHPHGPLAEWSDYTALLANYWRDVGLEINMMTGEVSVWQAGWEANDIPGTVAINAADVSATSWIDQLIGYRSFMAPVLPRALVWDTALGDMLDEVEPAGDVDADEAARLLRDIARYTKDRYIPGFSVVTVDSTFAIGQSVPVWTPRALPHSFGDFEQVVVRSGTD